MGIVITAKNFEITKSIRQYVNQRFEKFCSKADKELDIRVLLELDKEVQTAEAILYVGGSIVKCTATDKDLYTSIDKLEDKLNYQINKQIDKSQHRKNDSIRFYHVESKKEEADIMGKNEKPIVKRKQFDLKPMMEEEAILQMEMLGHDFFFFFNGEIEKTCLLYKRKDGNYGLIESTYK